MKNVRTGWNAAQLASERPNAKLRKVFAPVGEKLNTFAANPEYDGLKGELVPAADGGYDQGTCLDCGYHVCACDPLVELQIEIGDDEPDYHDGRRWANVPSLKTEPNKGSWAWAQQQLETGKFVKVPSGNIEAYRANPERSQNEYPLQFWSRDGRWKQSWKTHAELDEKHFVLTENPEPEVFNEAPFIASLKNAKDCKETFGIDDAVRLCRLGETVEFVGTTSGRKSGNWFFSYETGRFVEFYGAEGRRSDSEFPYPNMDRPSQLTLRFRIAR